MCDCFIVSLIYVKSWINQVTLNTCEAGSGCGAAHQGHDYSISQEETGTLLNRCDRSVGIHRVLWTIGQQEWILHAPMVARGNHWATRRLR